MTQAIKPRPNPENKLKPKVVKASRLKILFYCFVVCSLSFLFISYQLIATQAGNQFLLSKVEAFEPRFSASLHSGDLISGLHLQKISWQTPELALSIDFLSLSWDWSCLHNSQLCIEQLATQGLRLKLTANSKEEAETESKPLIDNGLFRWPFNFAIHKLSMKATHLDIFGEKISWNTLQLAIDGNNYAPAPPASLGLGKQELKAQLQLKQFELTQLNINLSAAHSEASATGAALNKNTSAIVLPEIELPFDLTVNAFELQGLLINQEQSQSSKPQETLLAMDNIDLQGQMRGANIHLTSLFASMPGVSVTALGDMSLLGDYPLDLQLEFHLDANEFLPQSDYHSSLSGSVAQLNLELSSNAPLPFSLAGQLQPLSAQLPFSADLQWRELNWPVIEQADSDVSLLSKQGALSVSGNLEQYHYHLDCDVAGSQIPKSRLESKGQGDLASLTIDYLTLALERRAELGALATSQLAENRVKLAGKLNWQQALSWQGDIEFQGLELAEFEPSLTGTLSGQTKSTFKLGNKHWFLSLNETQIEGRINERPVQLLATIQGHYPVHPQKTKPLGEWLIERFEFASGNNTLIAKGKVDKRLALKLELDFPHLSELYSSLSGQASALLTLRGLANDPILDYQINAQNLLYQLAPEPAAHKPSLKQKRSSEHSEKVSAQGLSSEGKLHVLALFNNDKQLADNQLELLVNELQYQDIKVSKGQFQLSGNTHQQLLSVAIDGQPYAANAKIVAGISQSKWRGKVEVANLNSPLGAWRLKPKLSFDFDLSSNRLSLGEHCWAYMEPGLRHSNGSGELCVNRLELGQQRKLALSLNDLPLSIFNGALADVGSVSGLLDGEFSLDWSPAKKPQASMALSSGPLELNLLSLQNKEDEIAPITLQSLALSSALNSDKLQLTLDVNSSTIGNSQLRLFVFPYQKNRPVRGELHLDDLSLEPILPLVPQLDHLQGDLRADVSVSGTLASPLLAGQIELKDMSASGLELPMALKQLDAKLMLKGQRAQLQANALTIASEEEGQVKLNGEFIWQELPLRAELDLRGNNVAIATNTLNLKLEPKLHFSLQEQAMILSGKLKLPEGRIKMRELPKGAVSESADVVILTKEKQQKKTAILPLILDLQLEVDDRVEIDAFGLKSNLTGNLSLRQKENKPLTANGEISLKEGTYKAWGQNLLIEQGQLIFSGLLDKPFLNIDAIRDPKLTENGVTAGVRIEGAAAHPEVNIYSEPAMSQQEAISYLIRGRGLSSGSNSSNDTAIAAMLLGFGLGQSEGIVSTIGDNLGIRELSVETKESADDTLVEVKGHILPGVEVGYGVSLTTNLPQITLKYEVFPKFYIEGVSGVESALDLLYEFEL